MLGLKLYFITDHIYFKIEFTHVMNGASLKKTPEHDSSSENAGYILTWVL